VYRTTNLSRTGSTNVMMRVVLWVGLTATLLPYFYARTEYRLLSYIVTVMLIIWTTSVFLLSPRGRRLAIHVARQSPHFLLYCALIFVAQSVSMLRTSELGIPDYTWGLGYIIIGLIAYFIFPIFIGNRLFRQWLAFLIVVGTFSSAIAIYVAFTGATQVLGFHIRQVIPSTALGIHINSSIFFEANRFAIVAFFGLLGSLYFLQRRQYILLMTLTLFLCIGGIFVSFSRAVYLSLALASSVWLITITKPSHRRRTFALLALLAISGYFIIIHVKRVNEILFGLGLARREILWPAAIQLIMERPLLGYGFGRAEIVQSCLYAYTGFATSIHSTPLSIAFRAGIPLAVLYLIIFGVSLNRLRTSKLDRPEKAIIVAGVVGTFGAAIFLEYTLGGAAYGTFVHTTFLGLANASPWLRSVPGRHVRGLTKRGGAD